MSKKDLIIHNIIESRKPLRKGVPAKKSFKTEEEGGCGVTGFASSIPVCGTHILEPSKQMHNRGNGLGGGIAAMDFDPTMLGVSREILEESYMLQIAALEQGVMGGLEKRFIRPWFEVDFFQIIPHVSDFRDIPGLTIKPPEVWRYFVRVRTEVLKEFMEKSGLQRATKRQAEDEFVFQNSFKINKAYYDVYKKQSAFVVSHGRNFFVLKIVGYAEQVVQYYQLENLKAHIWIAHQRYPTKGRVWHPAGAHPFVGLNEALVHNGDFANYHSVVEYLRQKNIHPLFLTDTEVSVLLFDLYSRTYGYPLEYVIEALAPSTERDFDLLPPEKQRIYRAIQATHIHGSPDGPWFFIIARNDTEKRRFQLIGITDTSMLRPQVFALNDGEVQVGLICSEKQAIDATLKSLAGEDSRIGPVADRYWNARGGSHTDGGAFIFALDETPSDPIERRLTCTDKFGTPIRVTQGQTRAMPDKPYRIRGDAHTRRPSLSRTSNLQGLDFLWEYGGKEIRSWDYDILLDEGFFEDIKIWGLKDDAHFEVALTTLTKLMDLRYPTNGKKRRSILQLTNETLENMCRHIPRLSPEEHGAYRLIDWHTRQFLREPIKNERAMIIDAALFPPEGEDSDSRLLVEAFHKGWKRFIVCGLKGQRFHGCGLGPHTRGVRIDIYGSSGDYLGSGIDGLSIYVHGNAQDQVGQIMKSGKMVIYGDTGQTFMYGAKGGEVYVLGNAAGRPLVNAVGKPRVVINGTCLDYLAESFMAGDPLNGGGFVVVNGVEFDEDGGIKPQATPYPGSNLFSLASGGAIYIRDPFHQVDDEQLNGGEIVSLEERDWGLILPCLKENEELFGISVEHDLLRVKGERMSHLRVYRKVRPMQNKSGDSGLEEWENTVCI
jgi:glutamate synthase domain-containing protein 1/glutamate synthase domain-containing protein 3